MDQNEYKEKANQAFKAVSDGKKIQRFVLGWTEFILPFLLIFSIVAAILTSLIVGIGTMQLSFISGLFTLFATLIGSLVSILISFYFIYCLKAIKDAIAGESVCCPSINEFKNDVPKTAKKEAATVKKEATAVKNEVIETAKKDAKVVQQSTTKATAPKKAPAKPRAKKTPPKES